MRIRRFRKTDAEWVVVQHQTVYAATEGFDTSFGPLVAEIVAGFASRHDPKREAGWIAERDGKQVGCIFCVTKSAEIAKLRLFLVLPEAQGLGVGARLLEECLRFAKAADYRSLTLWTHAEHEAACHLYQRAGFVCCSSQPVHAFGRDLTEQHWSLTF